MAKIIVPFSGGVNSTFALWRWLKETDHESLAVFGEDQWPDLLKEEGRGLREKASAEKITDWLKSNVRDFDLEIIQWPMDYVLDEKPIRFGGTSTMNVGAIEPRYHGYKKLIDEKSPDGIDIGISLENTATDTVLRFIPIVETNGVDIYFAGQRELTPIPPVLDMNYDVLSEDMMGRFEQLDLLPDELIEMIESKCSVRHDPRVDSENLCMSCLYEIVREERTDMTGKEIDDAFAKHGSYGKWRGEADLETYKYRGVAQLCALDLLGIELAGGEDE